MQKYLCFFLYLLVALFPVFHKSLYYEVSRSRIYYEKLMGALDSGRFDHSKPSFVGIGHDDDSIAHVGAEEDEDVPMMYILCFAYIHLCQAEKELKSRGVKYGHYYSSCAKDLGCLLVTLDGKEKSSLLFNASSTDVQCNLLLPLGNMRKLETSLLVGLAYLYHTSSTMKSQDDRVILQEMEKDHVIAHHLASYLRADKRSNTQEIATPMQITIGINTSWTDSTIDRRYNDKAEVHRKYIDRWLSHEYMELRTHRSKFFDFTYHDKQAYENEYRGIYGNPQTHRKDKGPKKLIDSIIKLSLLQLGVNNVHNNRYENQNERRRHQNHGVDGSDDDDDDDDSDGRCDYSPLKFTSHNNRIDIKLSVDSMKKQKNVICLFHLVRAVAADPAVSMMSLSPSIRLLNYHARCIIQSGAYDNEPWSSLGLDGKGQIVGVSDTGIDENNCFFRDPTHGQVIKSSIDDPKVDHNNRKIVEYITYSDNYGDVNAGHGSHVCGSIAGSCLQDDHISSPNTKKYHGIAPQAKIAFFDIMGDDGSGELFIPYYFQDLFEPAYYAGAKLHSDSWGGGYTYDSFCLDVDDYTYTHPDFLAFFAAGNDGYHGARTILSPAMAKNAVAVGGSISSSNSAKIKTVASFSAEGPTMDGRIKPDIIVPGESISSAKGYKHSSSETCDLVSKQGTSMATPVAAGAAALIRQYFEDPSFWGAMCATILPYSNFDVASFVNFESLCNVEGIAISASLLKTLVVHGGTNMVAGRSVTNFPPDFRQGFGLLSLTTLLPKANSETWSHYLFIDEAYISSFQERAYTITIYETQASEPIKVTLSWMDPPNMEFAAKVLLHDLDVSLTTPEGKLFYGNSKGLTDAPRDEVNNVEKISLPSSAIETSGMYVVRVQSKLLTQRDQQKFSIVITSDISSHVSTIIESDLSPSIFDECATISSSSIAWLSTEISLFDLVGMNGWSRDNSYRIVRIDESTNSESSVITSALSSGLEYDVHNTCLQTGHYFVELILNSHYSDPGVMLEIPQCSSLFIAPLAYKRLFDIVTQELTFNTSNTERLTSVSVCDSAIPGKIYGASIDMTLFEGGGIGWSGAYYSTHWYSISSAIIGQADGQVNGIVAGTLEWDYSKGSKLDVTDLYIPSDNSFADNSNVCYLLHLSIPIVEDLEPILAFDEAYEIVHGVKRDCSRAVQTQSPIATICRNDPNFDVDARLKIQFYAHTSSDGSHKLDFGQSKATYAELNTYMQNTHAVGGICYIEMDLNGILKAIHLPTAMPSFLPTEAAPNNYDNSTAMIIDDDDFVANVTSDSMIPFDLPHEVRNAIIIFMTIIQVILIFLAIKFVMDTKMIDNTEKDEDVDLADNDETHDDISVICTSPPSGVHTSRPQMKNHEDGDEGKQHADEIKNPLHRVFKSGGKNHKRKGDGQSYEMISLDSSSHQLDISIRGEDCSGIDDDDDDDSDNKNNINTTVEAERENHGIIEEGVGVDIML